MAAKKKPRKDHGPLGSPSEQVAGAAAVRGPQLSWQGWLCFGIMVAAVLFVWASPELLRGGASLVGLDFPLVHAHRMEYAKEALRTDHSLPGWYTRELLGTPFWSNIQSFPWIPTRLVLLLFDVNHAYAVGVILAALLSALFTFLFARRIGMGPPAAACAGWTFACAGYFASRVLAGHLPLLEAYPALPFLLWLSERALDRVPGRFEMKWRLLALALGTAAIALAGHPQLPAYAIATTLAYILWRERSSRGFLIAGAMVAGALSTLFAWWPTVKLIQRSTRLLALSTATNDVALPLGRLRAFVAPWADGWPKNVERLPLKEFSGYPEAAYFYDTVSYVGILPLVAVIALVLVAIVKRKWPDRIGMFFTGVGILSVLTALPFAQGVIHLIPGTFLRSPSRQLYLTTFCLCLALGWVIHLAVAWARVPGREWAPCLIFVAVLGQGIDLGLHARPFIKIRENGVGISVPDLEKVLSEQVGSGRVAMDYNAPFRCNRTYDDVGFFDSITLSGPYCAILGLAGLPQNQNVQFLKGSDLSPQLLASLCVKFVITNIQRDDLALIGPIPKGFLYGVPNPAPRFSFLPDRVVPSNDGNASCDYERPTADRMVVKVKTAQSGTVRLVESWDQGWSARLDGKATPVVLLEGYLMGIKVPAGDHTLTFTYRTPGATTGLLLSLLGPALLLLLIRFGRREEARTIQDKA